MNLLRTTFFSYRVNKNIKIPYNLQWETRDFYVKNIKTKYKNNISYDKQWETRDFYRKKK
tara:strand:+ start:79 stop:258 length:180 start_codon:yes stop_codon:yes gene_type:complete